MTVSYLKKPHGGSLIQALVEPDRAALLKNIARDLPDVTLNDRHLCDLEMLASGAFSPLAGFMTRPDYEAVLDRMELQTGVLWPIPICLDITETKAANLEAGQSAALRDPEGFLLAIIHIEDIWAVDRQKEALAIYGTDDHTHPGVYNLLHKTGDFYIGGPIEVLSPPLHFDFKQQRYNPAEIRQFAAKLGWQRLAAFPTANPIHRPQFEMTMAAMRRTRANLLLLPMAGTTQPGDFDYYTRMRCYREISRYYPPDSHMLSLLPLYSRMAGPKEAVWLAIIAKNYGATHFMVGPSQGNPTDGNRGQNCYRSHELQKMLEELAPALDIEIIPFEEMIYLQDEDEFTPAEKIPDDARTMSVPDREIYQRIRTGRKIPPWASFPEVIRELRRSYPPPKKQGFSIFMTGLSGAGKSTVARVLYARFLEIGERPVTLLDGDIVRRHLSSELGFSKEHRDINVRRIGYVASEITKNRGIALCAPIAPYERTRREVREMIQEYGGFIEVHVATPLDICEQRDRKGMYAKARAGLIKGYTGVDDPYEVPVNPEVRIDTTELTPEECAQEIMLYLGQKGFI